MGTTASQRQDHESSLRSIVLLALGISRFAPYSILHQCYRQTDHANKTWADLRLDIEMIITNNITGTSRDPIFRTRERSRWDQPPAENRASRIDILRRISRRTTPNSTTTASAIKTPITLAHRTFEPPPRPQLHPLQPPRVHTNAPTAELTTAQPSARTPTAISARLPSLAQLLARHTTWPITSTNQSGSDSDQPQLATTTPHPHHHSSPAPQRT